MKITKTERILHELNVECKNPTPDRRKKDNWHCMSIFPQGLYLLVNETYAVEHEGKVVGEKIVQTFEKIGWMSPRYGSITNTADEEAFDALLAHTTPIEPDPRKLQHIWVMQNDIEAQWIGEVLAWLLEHGVVNKEQIEIAIAGVLKKWDDEEN